ncbi:MFS transporter [Cytobacillus oceanisediminis]|uniref:MFS transporter n=1 Tax=Cytobacillus oceanisediminis TaxID=665099 RepID=UPI0018641116|nr:MFS transporter [Cytobacillus oceanisediminis]QOK29691.1 MFS transporter [Cytobacillus oceanisediminis]
MLLVSLLMSCGATFITPLFPLYSEAYRLNSLQITILFAIYAAFLLPALFITGEKGSTWGLKRVVRISIWISIASTLFFLAGNHSWMLYLARSLEGIAYGAFTGTAAAFLMKQTSPSQMSAALKLSGVTILIGFGLGPAIAGLILQYIHYLPLHLPFWILLVLLIISLCVLETIPKDSVSVKRKISLGVPNNIRSPFFSMAGLPIFTVFTIQGIAFALIPNFVKNVIHTSNLAVSGLIIFVLLSGAALAQFIPWPSHPITRMRFGILLLAVGSWIIVSSGLTSSLPLLWAGIFIQSIGGGWTFQIALRLAGQLPEPKERPRVISVFYLCAYSGFIVPVIGVGALTQFFSLNHSLIVLNLFAAFIVIYVLLYSVRYNRTYSDMINP